ncbi:MAG TPA: DNA repair exonuclease [Candidatus Sulfotelmatobacter sp.]|nr:DNA repair exonuclease [Candidatus Sulfotelmatobacter sp.]
MPRLLHVADVHLGARHQDLGPAASAQRERQFEAFRRAIDLALEERVDVVIVAGDLFDSNQQPRRSVERAAAEFGRVAAAGGRVVLIPGTHDAYDPSSVYRAYDVAALAGVKAEDDAVVLLTPERPEVLFAPLDLLVFGRVFSTKRAPRSPLAGFAVGADTRARWRVGVVHGSLRIEGKVTEDDVLFTDAEIAASGLDYLALGHWHSFQQGRAGATTWAYAGSPEPVAVDQDGAGQVVLVTLEERDGQRQVRLEARRIGRTRFMKLDVDAAEVPGQPALVERIAAHADPDLVMDARLVGVEPDELDVHEEEVEQQLAGRFLRLRFRDLATPAPPAGPPPPPDTIPGAFMRDLEVRAEAARAAGRTADATELAEALRLGRLLLDDPQRVTLG